MGQLTNTRRSDDGPDPDGSLKEVARIKIRHYRNIYLNHPDSIAFKSNILLLFLHDHREESALANELPEVSDQFRFPRASCFTNLKGDVRLIMTTVSDMWISIPLDLSSRPSLPMPCFIRSCRPTPLLTRSLVLLPPCSA